IAAWITGSREAARPGMTIPDFAVHARSHPRIEIAGTGPAMTTLVVSEGGGREPAGSLRSRGLRHALEGELLQALSGRCDVDVALGVGGDEVAAADQAGNVDRADLVERLAVEDRDLLAVADIEELLLRIGRQGDVAGEQRAALEMLLDELAVVGE